MKPRLWLILSLAASAITLLYMQRILGPWEYFLNVELGRVIAQMGDLYPRWVGTRNLLLYGKNPYGPETSHEIQMAFYGHPIMQDYAHLRGEPIDEQRFVYPVYVVFLLAPTVHANFATVNAYAIPVLVTLVAGTIILWMSVIGWRPPPLITAAICVFILATPQIAQGLRLRQLAMLVAFLFALATWCLVRGKLAPAGVCLAFATLKPQMAVLALAWFAIWAVGDFRARWKLPASFAVALGVLGGAGEILLPSWPRDFIEGIVAYSKYFKITSLLRFSIGDIAGTIAGVLIVVALLVYAWTRRTAAAKSDEFLLTLATFFMVSALVLPLMVPANQVLLILPVSMALRDWNFLTKFFRRTVVLLVAWPWVVEVVLLLFPPQIRSLNRLPLLPSALELFIPFAVPLWLMATERNKLRSEVVASV